MSTQIKQSVETINTDNLVVISNDQPITTSLKIAEYFGKRHDNILQKIETLETSQEFRDLNFKESQYDQEMPTGGIKKIPMYQITKDGFTFLTMGFTGSKAAKFKENYILAFNKMEATLKNQIQKPILDIRIVARQLLDELDKKEIIIQEKNQLLEAQKPAVEFTNQVNNAINSITVQDFAKVLGTGEIRLYTWLRENSFLMSKPRNRPYQNFIELGIFKVIEKTYKDLSTGESKIYTQTLITGKGQTYLTKKYLKPNFEIKLIENNQK